jgi:hypothetical protein
MNKPDVAAVMRGLKDFQRDTVEYVYQRLFLDSDKQRRFLIADEVGLGKTLVARGLIAKAIDSLWDEKKGDRIDVVYICSNASIARQNINRLNVTGEESFEIASRITLLPVTIRDLKHRKLNFISFTPGTSFDLKSSLGQMDERALLFWLLTRAWKIEGKAPLNVLQGNAEAENFRWRVQRFEQEKEIDESLAEEFARSLKLHDDTAKSEGQETLRSRFDKLCSQFGRIRQNIPEEESRARREFVGELRELLATTCLTALEPDLVILDEFQRFRHLLDGTDKASGLARDFFEHPEVRLILLSATPYKMLTLQTDRDDGEDHYEDFLRTVRFLQNDAAATERFKLLLAEYRLELLRLGNHGTEDLKRIGRLIEDTLRRVMSRTERLAESADRNGMLEIIPCAQMHLDSAEVETYLHLQKVARLLEQSDVLEYWKSAPYLLNFMDQYEIKDAFQEALGTDLARPLSNALQAGAGLLLSPEHVEGYGSIAPLNARLRQLQADTIEPGAWKLLWIPPALPYYKLGGPFAESGLQHFTKRLIFSAWRVVPRAIASLLSYEAERRIHTAFEARPKNNQEARKRRRPLLRFAKSAGRLTGMPVLGLFYPSMFLAREVDSLQEFVGTDGIKTPLDAADVLERIQAKLEPHVQSLCAGYSTTGLEDETWYWAAPIMLDLRADAIGTISWWHQTNLASIWAGSADEPAEEVDLDEKDRDENEKTAWTEHVALALSLVENQFPLDHKLGRPPADLARVLAQLALGGPAISALRSLRRTGCSDAEPLTQEVELALRNGAGQIAWGFGRLFNLPEAILILRGMNRAEPYWLRVLEYCIDGCFQAMLDEYQHVLRESLGLIDKSATDTITAIAQTTVEAVSLRTATLSPDYIRTGFNGVLNNRDGPGMRMHFAVRFGDEKAEEEKSLVRSGQVRTAFNSPFWPFVLATTSVGQEGLDFHTYCHAVVHWNLPANPVDLEQREGRVHRYKGHAIRKNVAGQHAQSGISSFSQDPWEQMFCDALAKRLPDVTHLTPFWIYPGHAKIQRHVPALPLSRDQDRMEALRKSLAVYRMVFGQIRQDDLISFLLARFPENQISRIAKDLHIDLAPPKPAPTSQAPIP